MPDAPLTLLAVGDVCFALDALPLLTLLFLEDMVYEVGFDILQQSAPIWSHEFGYEGLNYRICNSYYEYSIQFIYIQEGKPKSKVPVRTVAQYMLLRRIKRYSMDAPHNEPP